MSQTPPMPDRYDPAGFRSGQDSPDLPPRPSRSPRLVQVGIVLGVFALVLVPVIWGALPGEVARWHDAAAQEKHLDGDLSGALAELDKAFSWNDQSAQRYFLRSQIRLDAQDYQGSLDDLESALRLLPDNPVLLKRRAEVLTHLGRFAEALDDHKKRERLELEAGASSEQARAEILNELAYGRGVANLELSEGLACAEETVKLEGGETHIWERAGFLHVLREDWANAERRLLEAEKLLQGEREVFVRQAAEALDKGMRDGVREKMTALESRLAGVQFHLSETYLKLKQPAKAEEYKTLALDWKQPESVLKNRLLQEFAAYKMASSHAAIIDTRGYLHYRLGNFEKARRDLELAVELSEVLLEYHRDFSKVRENIVDIRLHRRNERAIEKSLAVILFHRALVYEKLGLDKQAAEDLRRVKEELRFTPDEHLF